MLLNNYYVNVSAQLEHAWAAKMVLDNQSLCLCICTITANATLLVFYEANANIFDDHCSYYELPH